MMPLISIVIPVLNEEELLPGCLQSLLSQDYTGHYEIVVVDNGSTDSSVAIAQKYGVRVLHAEEQQNVHYARDFGARAVTGDIIVQADADTLYPRGWLSRIVRDFESHPKAVAVAGNFIYREKVTWGKSEFILRYVTNMVTQFLFGRLFLVSGATLAFKREAFLAAGGYNLKAYAPDQFGICGQLGKIGQVFYDRKLTVATSPRRSRKPLAQLLAAVASNVYHFFEFHVRANVPNWTSKFTVLRPVRVVQFMPLLAVPAILAYGYFVPSSPVFGQVYAEVETEERIVALTFDDGPDEPYTSQILDILKIYNIKATFFVIGMNVELYPDTAKRILAEGHVLGNHSYSHKSNHALSANCIEDILMAQDAIFSTLGVEPHLYRPLDGKSPWELNALKQENIIPVTWSISASEQQSRSVQSLSERIIAETEPGGIILLNDGAGTVHNSPEADDRTATVQALPSIIESLKAQGYHFVTIPELLGVPAYN